MSRLPVQTEGFRVDTSRPRSRTKMRAKFRTVLGVSAGVLPLMALVIFLMSFLQIPEQREKLHLLALILLGSGMVVLMFYAWARAEKLRRREISARNREARYREQAEHLRQEREKKAAERSAGNAQVS